MNKFLTVIAIVVMATALYADDSFDQSYAGTIDGIGMPMAHFNFYQNQAWEMLVWQFDMPHNDPETDAWAAEIAFESLIELHLTTSHAADFGLSVDDVDMAEVQEQIATLRLMYNRPDIDVIATLGFTEVTFREFAEMQILHEMVYQHITSLAVITEEEMASAFEQFLSGDVEFAVEWAGDAELLEIHFKQNYEQQLRNIYFRARLDEWRNAVEIVPNAELFRSGNRP